MTSGALQVATTRWRRRAVIIVASGAATAVIVAVTYSLFVAAVTNVTERFGKVRCTGGMTKIDACTEEEDDKTSERQNQ